MIEIDSLKPHDILREKKFGKKMVLTVSYTAPTYVVVTLASGKLMRIDNSNIDFYEHIPVGR